MQLDLNFSGPCALLSSWASSLGFFPEASLQSLADSIETSRMSPIFIFFVRSRSPTDESIPASEEARARMGRLKADPETLADTEDMEVKDGLLNKAAVSCRQERSPPFHCACEL